MRRRETEGLKCKMCDTFKTWQDLDATSIGISCKECLKRERKWEQKRAERCADWETIYPEQTECLERGNGQYAHPHRLCGLAVACLCPCSLRPDDADRRSWDEMTGQYAPRCDCPALCETP